MTCKMGTKTAFTLDFKIFIIIAFLMNSIQFSRTNLKLRILSPQILRNQQTIVAANFPFYSPINVEIIHESNGSRVRTGPDSQLMIYSSAVSFNSSVCLSADSDFSLSSGVGKFQGSFCEGPRSNVHLSFQCNSSHGSLKANLPKPISITNDIHLAYYQPLDDEKVFDNNLVEFIKFVINGKPESSQHTLNSTSSFGFLGIAGRSIKLTTYIYQSNDSNSPIKEYLRMKEFHKKNPDKMAYGMIGMNNNFASRILMPLMTEDKYAVTSYRKDTSSRFEKNPFFNRIHLPDYLFLENVLIYLVKNRKWSKIIFIYTTDDDEMDIDQFIKSGITHGMTILVYKITGKNKGTGVINYDNLFKKINESGLKIIVTTVTGKTAKNLMKKADQYNVTTVHRYQWIGLKSENEFNFLVENNSEFNNTQFNDPLSLISMRFKGMIFIDNGYNTKKTDIEDILLNFLSKKNQRITRKMFQYGKFSRELMLCAQAYDVVKTKLLAIERLISANKTVDGTSLSKYIRQNISFEGMSGKINLNPLTGSRDYFMASVYIIWSDLSNFTQFSNTDEIRNHHIWKEIGHQFIFEIILLEKENNSIVETKILNPELLKILRNVSTNESIFDAHHISKRDGSKNLMNNVNVMSCEKFYHGLKRILIREPTNYLQISYRWYWPEETKYCEAKSYQREIPAPFYCQAGCGGKQLNVDDINNFDNGECIAQNKCKCEDGKYQGDNCLTPICLGCHQEFGNCIQPGNCACKEGFNGTNCTNPICDPPCKSGGICQSPNVTLPNVCKCNADYYGKSCGKVCTCWEGKCNNGINGTGYCRECNSGYYGQNCDSLYLELCLYIALGTISLIIIMYLSMTAIQNEIQHRQSLVSNDWIIKWSELKLEEESSRQGGVVLSAISMNSKIRVEKKQLNIGSLNGTDVYYQKIDKDTIELTKEIHSEIKQVQNIKHSNIVKLMGCLVNTSQIAVITELQHKGSIQDILANGDLDIPWKFKFSLMKDICKGLAYIHNSKIGSHGRLKSSNCLVDNKWTVKLSGFGLHLFRYGQKSVGKWYPGISNEIQTVGCDYESLLWTSPEILMKFVYHIDHVGKGTASGDIYSFAMILSEFCTRHLPFYDLVLNKADLINLIAGAKNLAHLKIWNDYLAKNNYEEGGWIRPCIQDKQLPSKLEVRQSFRNLIENCWDEHHIKRPSVKECEVLLNQIDPQRMDTMGQLVATLEQYSTNLENVVLKRNKQLQREVERTENLLSRQLPKSVAENLKQGKFVEPEYFENVTVYVSKIVGFSSIAKVSTTSDVINLLNEVYSLFDSITENYDFFKIESIGGSYSFVSGLTTDVKTSHVGETCTAALYLMSSLSSFANKKNINMQLQTGIHTGSIVTGLVGLKTPKYCVYGDTVTVATHIESAGEPSSIYITEATYAALCEIGGGYNCEFVNELIVLSKSMKTYWLKGKDDYPSHMEIVS